MALPHDSKRRVVITALASLPLSSCTVSNGSEGEMQQGEYRTLVAYFSRTGNTRVIAGLIHRKLGADLFEIRLASPYPEDYLATVEQARQERGSGFEPALEAKVSNMAAYDTVYLGFPIWGETTPPVIRSFLKAHDLSGKVLIPLVTHGGYGLGNSQAILASYAPMAQLHRGFSLEADQERRTINRVKGWLGELDSKC